MISQKVEHATVSRFLFCYLKCKILNIDCDEKRKVVDTVVDLLHSLDASSVSCKGLLDILRICSSQNIISRCCRDRLENMIGSRIDQAGLDNLLVSSPSKTHSRYDVDLILRLLEHFLAGGGGTASVRLKKVGRLVDLYMAEVAPDSFLKPSKFLALATALPEGARDSHDSLYGAITMYLEVHNKLSSEEKMQICGAISYKKLSLESCKHLTQNSKFPTSSAVQALLFQRFKLKSLLEESTHLKTVDDPSAKKLDLSSNENERVRARLEGMQCRMLALEKACWKMQSQMANMTKTNHSSTPKSSITLSLPRMCS